ncbi:hypothetical protein CRV24_003018 [Beauveria bassiana]|nr:hypothetical protein CRV24_003018 [Beauveria bassiana]
MAPTHVLDNYYLAITAIVTVGFQLACFFVAYSCQFDKITDLAGGLNFTMLAVLTLALSGAGTDLHPRQLVVSLFMIAWSVRLAGFLFFRILKTGKDERFNDMRGKFLSFLGFWVFQMLWVWTVSLPVTLLNSPNVTRYPQRPFGTGRDVAGVVLFAVGFVFEAGSDAYKALYASILGPVFITLLLLFVSGMPLAERPKAKDRYEKGNNWVGYKRWLDRTSPLIPFPPQLYARVPVFLKRSVFLELPMYVFDPAKHSDVATPGGGRDGGDSTGRGNEGRESAEQRLV